MRAGAPVAAPTRSFARCRKRARNKSKRIDGLGEGEKRLVMARARGERGELRCCKEPGSGEAGEHASVVRREYKSIDTCLS